MELFQHGLSLAEPEIPILAKFAIVISEAIRNDAHFIETVGRNRSANLRNFESRNEALAWLKE